MHEETIPLTPEWGPTRSQFWVYGLLAISALLHSYSFYQKESPLAEFFFGLALGLWGLCIYFLYAFRNPSLMPHIRISAHGIAIKPYALLPGKSYPWREIGAIRVDWSSVLFEFANSQKTRKLRINHYAHMKRLREMLHAAVQGKDIPVHDVAANRPEKPSGRSRQPAS